MTPRELAGAINKSRSVFVWAELDFDNDEGGMWVEVAKVAARKIVTHCREHGIEEIEASVEKNMLYISATGTGDAGFEDGEEEDDDGSEEE